MPEPDDTIMSGLGGLAGGGCGGAFLGHVITERQLTAKLIEITWQHLSVTETGTFTITSQGELASMAAQRGAATALTGYVAIGVASGLAGGVVGHHVSDYVEQQTGSEAAGKVAGTLAGAATGLAIGAAIGSVVPGVGTAAGAAVGAVCGAIGGFIGSFF